MIELSSQAQVVLDAYLKVNVWPGGRTVEPISPFSLATDHDLRRSHPRTASR